MGGGSLGSAGPVSRAEPEVARQAPEKAAGRGPEYRQTDRHHRDRLEPASPINANSDCTATCRRGRHCALELCWHLAQDSEELLQEIWQELEEQGLGAASPEGPNQPVSSSG